MANDFIAPSSLMPSSMPMPGVFKPWVSGSEQFGQESAVFNSELTTRDGYMGNATLTIYLRLHLIKRDTINDISPRPTADGADLKVVPWGTPTDIGNAYDFAVYTRKVKEQAEKFWDNTNLCLIPPADYRGLEYPSGSQKMRPNIDCRFKIVWAAGRPDAHAVIDCFCPHRPRRFRPYVKHSQGTLGGQWTCYDLTAYVGDNMVPDPKGCLEVVGDPLGDATLKTVRCNKELAHEAVCHEVGHLLGLTHVGQFYKTPDCVSAHDSGAQACYRGPTDAGTENIMGSGDKISLWNVMPWASRATSHTGVGLQGWRANLGKVAPRRV